MQDGEPWWIAKDVCDILELSNSREAIKSLDDDEKSSVRISDGTSPMGGNPNMNIINEFGVYTLIMRSNKPEAKRFKRWVTHEVLPTLRKSGRYVFNLLSGHSRLITTHGGLFRCSFAVTSKPHIIAN